MATLLCRVELKDGRSDGNIGVCVYGNVGIIRWNLYNDPGDELSQKCWFGKAHREGYRMAMDELDVSILDESVHSEQMLCYRNGVTRGVLYVERRGHSRRKQMTRCDALFPRIAFRDVAACWFVYEGMAYGVQSVGEEVLRKAVQGMIHDERVQALLVQGCLDLVERWYILCEAKGLRLYQSRQEAEGVIGQAARV